jgi:hypothetical protein
MNKKVLIIIPAYNEEKSIEKTVRKLIKLKYDYVVINDGSKDDTAKILDKNNFNHIDLVHNLGIGGAVQTGYKYAKENNYDIAVQFDGDGQHDEHYIKKLIDPLIKEKVDLTVGSRFLDESSSGFKSTKMRIFGIKLISWFIKLKTKEKIFDVTSGFRACNKKLIDFFSKDYPFEYPEPITNTKVLLNGYKVEEIPVNMYEREEGKSSIYAYKNIYYMINVILSILLLRRNK